jgi:hypothetical protein
MKRKIVTLLLLFVAFVSFSQTKSPEQFLGYPLGSKYTSHHNLVNYCRHVAETSSNMVKLEQYGVTNEGRPLLLLYISSPENMVKLEQIRQNNLRLAGMSNDKTDGDVNAPTVVWMSYNVHGNEASSSEAAMLTLYELANPNNNKAKEWLKNTVVIIDPCINPDGRDRYVNWYNSVVGKKPNPVPFTREHSEPWPGGRSNHYYFDLNRDWVWQTQVESQQRIAKYNQWLPHVHVDFHEQGYNNPYYFAPAAEPYHEVITNWQREFQVTIGKNNAKYFDQNGWLFFTKERFDLFYPSYGDTYPLYRGAIGMTYEQAGHSRSGAAVITSAGDTLTLWDRLYHHFTTGMSTVEITSINAARVVQEFKKYYDKARTTPLGDYKAYVVKADEGDRLSRLKVLLDRNKIEWYDANNNGSYTGFNYFTGKTEQFKTTNRDIIINANQPNSTLLKVLFERESKLSDSATYDITAWSIPFSYGLLTYGLNTYVTGLAKTQSVATVNTSVPAGEGTAAWLVRWNGVHSMRFLGELLQKGIKVRFSEQPFSAGQQDYDRGTLIITRAGNQQAGQQLAAIVETAAKNAGVSYQAISSTLVDKGFDFGSDRVHVIQKPKIALLAGEGVSSLSMGQLWHFFDETINYPVNVIGTNDLNPAVLKEVNVLILPDGNYRFLGDKSAADGLKDWVRGGGKIIALENAVAQLARGDWGIKMKQDDDKKDGKKDSGSDYSFLRRYENRERDYLSNFSPGAIFKVELDNSHPLAFGYDATYFTLKQDDRIYEFFKDNGWNVGVIKKDNQVAGFVGSNLKQKLRDGLLFGVQHMGRGSLVYLADDPIFRSFWENGKLLLGNAIFLVGQD